ncbi:unnamed protein product [Rotaria sordida]|uniref:Uncharacterized protein n=1 Tax=Rotaria sordida TaxID=392033 RepID=A0A820ADS7_9BILA|nr:unnamed protein product [Rotaria sordida]CAF1506258.1 unnamed protein product [Rotaria sordida]CAF1535126.1 unnamed protein product [Rotaria sordida]CAF3610377.1 unnamed protein product [Rotaria sordida]CAF3929176.1 unnamed protein product [Rotaria sordida]
MKKFFQYLFLFYIIQIVHSKSVKKYDECDRFLIVNDCYYFPCLDAHYSCGRDSHLVRFTYDFCVLPTQKYAQNLTSNAVFYLNHTNICAMTSLNDQLIEEKISGIFSCAHLHALIFKIYLNCFQNHQRENKMIKVIDFCSIICQNLQPMIDLFLNLNEAHFNVLLLLIETGKNCGALINDAVMHTIPSALMAICLDRKNLRLEQEITEIMFNPRYEADDYDWT